MTDEVLNKLQSAVGVQETFIISDYFKVCHNFLCFIESRGTTRIISPFATSKNYIFYQYGEETNNKITRPLNTNLFIESPQALKTLSRTSWNFYQI
jgi:hypothetical protein